MSDHDTTSNSTDGGRIGSVDDPNRSPGEVLDWLCWMWAQDGERFYPPDETAEECAEALEPDRSEHGELYAREFGQHARAYDTAVHRFRDLEGMGYDPVARAEREIERAREDDLDLPDIDWTWWEDSWGFDDV